MKPKPCPHCLNGIPRARRGRHSGFSHTIVKPCTDQKTEMLRNRSPVFVEVAGKVWWLGEQETDSEDRA